MEIYDLDGEFFTKKEYGIALGNFDGIHIGHKSLIDAVVRLSKENKITPSVLLFKNHTIAGTKLLTNLQQKEEILADLQVETIFLKKFDKEFMSLSAEDFVDSFLKDRLNAKIIVVGEDYRFGYKAEGDVKELVRLAKKNDMEVEVEELVKSLGTNTISSSNIRRMIEDGDVQGANDLLYKRYCIVGKVVGGNKRGRKLGFPTANLELKDNFVIPKRGVYLTEISHNNHTYKGITNIGTNPTFKLDDDIRIETYILDFHKEIYGEEIKIFFIKRIRDEIMFQKEEDLIEKMNKDLEVARKWTNLQA